MANEDLLTAVEFEKEPPHPEIVNRIEACRARFGVTKSEFRILDWGCGRGKLVLWLRQRGYNAVGVDIDPRSFANGADLFNTLGHSPQECLHALTETGRAPFPDSAFHFIVSWQMLEHVSDLGVVVRELRRVTVDQGDGFHVYPPHHRIVEGHLFMPFVHWLPKNGLRRSLMKLFVLLRIDPDWWPNERMPFRDKLDTYYNFSVAHTFYRTPAEIQSCFKTAGFEIEFSDVESWRRSRRLIQSCLFLGPSSRLVRMWYLNYGHNLGLATRLVK